MVLQNERRSEIGRKLLNIESDFIGNSYVVSVSRCGYRMQTKQELEQLRQGTHSRSPRNTSKLPYLNYLPPAPTAPSADRLALSVFTVVLRPPGSLPTYYRGFENPLTIATNVVFSVDRPLPISLFVCNPALMNKDFKSGARE